MFRGQIVRDVEPDVGAPLEVVRPSFGEKARHQCIEHVVRHRFHHVVHGVGERRKIARGDELVDAVEARTFNLRRDCSPSAAISAGMTFGT
jgi:hypothetical protein